jgi:cysteine synthase A
VNANGSANPRIYNKITDLIGKTPLLELHNFRRAYGLNARIVVKPEYFNPGGSVKDRAALAMILDAEERGLLRPGSAVIEPTSGNTGIGLAAVAASRGYRVIITMPDNMSRERQLLITAYGAEIVLTNGADGMPGAIAKANELAGAIPGAFIPGQFSNPANPAVHYDTTGPEIWADTDGQIDIFVAGIGTGGTISGAGAYLRKQSPGLYIAAVEPKAPPPHGIQGIGAGFVPEILDTSVYDEIITVTKEDAYALVRAAAKTEGLLVGISSGAALFAAAELARRPEHRDKMVVAVLPDSGERYLSVDSLWTG